jgi:hypothetical protein
MKAIADAANVLASFVGRREGHTFQLLQIATANGVAVAFYERSKTEAQSLLAVLLDEPTAERWTSLGASELATGGSRAISIRPSDRGDWILAIYGSAPPKTNFAVIDLDGQEHRIRIEQGVYAHMTRSPTEPKPTTVRPLFE